MTNTRFTESRNKREGFYRGYLLRKHMRDKRKWATLKGNPSECFVEWMKSIGLGR